MSSPYIRRVRLGMELRALRAEHNMTQSRVGRLIGKRGWISPNWRMARARTLPTS